MDTSILVSNLTNPTLLFFVLGIVAATLRSDLQIPHSSSKFISLYLLFSIGFKGGQELAHSASGSHIVWDLGTGMLLATLIPLYTFFILRVRLKTADAAAVAAAYGSVSAVTFVAASAFIELQGMRFSGHMVAVMALMEAPAIVIGVLLFRKFDREGTPLSLRSILHHALTNGSVLLIVGSLLIGYIADTRQAEGIKPFTTDIFKGFLAIFLLEMGMLTARRIHAFRNYGWFVAVFAIVIPAVNGSITALFTQYLTDSTADRLMFAILAASASYIAVPAAMKLAVPKADPGLYIPMAIGITFPFNISVGMPLYYQIIGWFPS